MSLFDSSRSIPGTVGVVGALDETCVIDFLCGLNKEERSHLFFRVDQADRESGSDMLWTSDLDQAVVLILGKAYSVGFVDSILRLWV